jgi:hypothetical protein
MAHQTQEPGSILVDRRDAPKALVDICQRMMAKKADQRFPTAGDVRDTLRKWVAEGDRTPASGGSGSLPKIVVAVGARGGSPAGDRTRPTPGRSERARGGSDSGLKRAKPLPPGTERPATPDDTLTESGRATSAVLRAGEQPGAGVAAGGKKLRVAKALDDEAPPPFGGIVIKTDDPIARRFEIDPSTSSIGWRRRRKRTSMLLTSAIVAGLASVGLLMWLALWAN